MRVGALILLAATALLTLSACRSSNSAKPVDDSTDWSMYGGTYDEQRFSP